MYFNYIYSLKMIENRKFIWLYLILIYIFLVFGFLSGEDPIKGAKQDFLSHTQAGLAFSNDFLKTFLNYNDIGMRHSPVLYILRSFFIENENLFRFLFLNLSLISVFFFFKSLLLKNINKNLSIFFSSLILILPTFRAYSFWPDPHLAGFLFFMISLYFFLKFEYSNEIISKKNYAYLNTIFLAISAYFSPNYGLMVIYYLFTYFYTFKDLKYFIKILLINILLALPFFYYLLILDVNFIFGEAEFNIGDNIYSLNNISNKIILILSLFLFYQLPMVLSLNHKKILYKIIEYKYVVLFISILYLFFCINFDFSKSFSITNSGGGIIYFISNKFVNNNSFLFLFSFISLLIQFYFSSQNRKNLLLYVCVLLSHPQETLWQANFSPLLFVITFTLFKFKINSILSYKVLIYYYVYFLIFYFTTNYRDFIL